MADAGAAKSGFLPIPWSSFYSVKKHVKTQEPAERLLELIADGNVSDIGGSDEEDAALEVTDACVSADFTAVAEDEDAAEEETRAAEEIDDRGDIFAPDEVDTMTLFNYFSRCPEEGCGKAYYSSNTLASHLRVHQHRPEELCCPFPECGRAFGRACKLRLHLRQHTGERPYACPYVFAEQFQWAGTPGSAAAPLYVTTTLTELRHRTLDDFDSGTSLATSSSPLNRMSIF
ncbi:hypothetical protein HPB50_022109 [Hyalomma asiaticum]|uniref:Uncharacterized protein n=1 Tax=Hyalomma asiaticum TaxID=266040 RepID=A0ACB7TLS8_HYAAI|nr:hypothetical protein HPB50_022109 [Hyalomma asiaticum]